VLDESIPHANTVLTPGSIPFWMQYSEEASRSSEFTERSIPVTELCVDVCMVMRGVGGIHRGGGGGRNMCESIRSK
jgi:hypothetical protein